MLEILLVLLKRIKCVPTLVVDLISFLIALLHHDLYRIIVVDIANVDRLESHHTNFLSSIKRIGNSSLLALHLIIYYRK
jgi:hypothetical protein